MHGKVTDAVGVKVRGVPTLTVGVMVRGVPTLTDGTDEYPPYPWLDGVGPTSVKLPPVEMQEDDPGYECAGLQAYVVLDEVRDRGAPKLTDGVKEGGMPTLTEGEGPTSVKLPIVEMQEEEPG